VVLCAFSQAATASAKTEPSTNPSPFEAAPAFSSSCEGAGKTGGEQNHKQ
jgi:hypothetical protein